MSQKKSANPLSAVLWWLLARDPQELARLLSEGVRKAWDLARFHRPEGIYEVLEHHTTVVLEDVRGAVAWVRREQRVRFLQDHVVALTDYAWGDGEILLGYRCEPGMAVDRYDDGHKKTILISLRETKGRGDVLDFLIQRQVRGGFTRAHEWWETEIYHRTQHLSVAIVFPRGRPCARATVTERVRNRTVALDAGHRRFLGDGRQELRWEIWRPRLNDRYIIAWDW